MAKRRNGHLRVRIEREQVVISIGVATLPKVVEFGHQEYDEAAGEYLVTKVTDPDVFAKEVLSELIHEEEDGTTLVHLMLDDAIARAIENGAEGVEVPEPKPLRQGQRR